METRIVVIDSIMGSGKAQPLYSKVLCSNGFKTMEEVQVGEEIFGEDGLLHKVIGVFPQGEKDIYEITFQDNSKVRCCGDHLWTYQLPQDKSKNKFRTETLKEIMNKPLYKQTNKSKNYQFFIPLVKPINFKHRDVEFDAWTLGCLLGDGGFSEGGSYVFTNSEDDIIDKIKLKLKKYNINLLKEANDYGYRMTGEIPNTKGEKGVLRSILKIKLDKLGLIGKKSNEKFIPNIYKMNDVEVRLGILRGLIDTDGHVDQRGNIDYSTASEQLAYDIKFIVESLGGMTTLKISQSHYTKEGKRIECKNRYRLYIIPPARIDLFSSKKHLSKLKGKKQRSLPSRNIRSIEYIGNEECKCILVDNPTHLYVTDNFVVTHNTCYAIQKMNEDKDGSYIYITPFLSEVQRIKENCSSKKFIEPKNLGKGKLDSFNDLLKKNKNIASTHALFKMANEDTMDLIRANDYTLILDEVMDVVMQIHLNKDDLKVLTTMNLIIVDDSGIVRWNDEMNDFDSKYNDMKLMCKNNSVFKVNDNLMMWTFPVEVFKSFKEVYVMTYKFTGQVQRYYYDLYNVNYEYKSVRFNVESNKYEITEYIEVDDLSEIRNLIHIVPNEDKLNRIGDDKYSLSKSWFGKKDFLHETINKNLMNFFKNRCKGKSTDNMWCTFKDYKSALSGKGYGKGFVSLGSRATNDYVDKKNLAYCANIFLNPYLELFFHKNGVTVDEDMYSLSELIQWIWRSQVRRGDEVNLYIPSDRMRRLLVEWLEF